MPSVLANTGDLSSTQCKNWEQPQNKYANDKLSRNLTNPIYLLALYATNNF